MYYQLKYGKHCLLKIAALVMAAVLGELIIWWGMIREDNVDWLAGQLIHHPWPYAITKMEDGRTIVSHILMGFEVILPVNWQVKETKHPSFYLVEEDDLKCEASSEIISQEEKFAWHQLRESMVGFTNININGYPGLEKENMTKEGNSIYELLILVDNNLIKYTLFAPKDNRYACLGGFSAIRRSWIYYPEAEIDF